MNAYGILVGKLEGQRSLGKPTCCGQIILRWISEREDVVAWAGLIFFRIGISRGLL
jgi:hypothetical protein